MEDGQTVVVESRFGKVSAKLKKDPTMKPGVIALSHMWGSALGDPVGNPLGSYSGRLISLKEGVQAINRMPRFSGVQVRVSSTANSNQLVSARKPP